MRKDHFILKEDGSGAVRPGDDVPVVHSGTLEVGHTADTHEVVVNHPKLMTDERGWGHIVFSPAQAMDFARVLQRHAIMARMEADGVSEEEAERIGARIGVVNGA
jgi:hypothetical protein